MSDSMNVLLTGGTGFLGEYLLAELLDRRHSVWAHYRSESRKLDTNTFLGGLGLPRSAGSLKWFKGDILEADNQWDQWRQDYKGIKTWTHFVAQRGFYTTAHGRAWGASQDKPRFNGDIKKIDGPKSPLKST
ncbi:MAG: NAD-dependent epimerase/dehydratase family protein [Desulfomonilaceae bacterium]|jgi:nucleoside-diphosphate-sugar epimerase